MNRVRIGKEEPGTIPAELHSRFIEHLGGCIHDGIRVGEDSPIRNIRGMRADPVRTENGWKTVLPAASVTVLRFTR